MFEETKGVIKDRQSQKGRQHKGQAYEETKRGNQRRQSQKDRQHLGHMFEETKRGNQRPSITGGKKTQEPTV
jgi:hypothetical protein